MSSDDLDKSLREEVEAYISRRLGSMQEEIFRLQSELNESFTRLVERSTGESMSDTSVVSTIAEHLRAAHERGVEQAAAESSKAKASSDLAIIKSSSSDEPKRICSGISPVADGAGPRCPPSDLVPVTKPFPGHQHGHGVGGIKGWVTVR